MNKVIATDLDGTLFYPKARINLIKKKSLKFVRKYIDDGGKFVIVSGRNEYFGKKVVKKINRPVDVIGCNGAFIYSGGEKIKEDYFDNERLKKLQDYIIKTYDPLCVFLMTEKYNLVGKAVKHPLIATMGYGLYSLSQGIYREPNTFLKKSYNTELKYGQIYKLMVMFGVNKRASLRAMEANRALRMKFGDEFEFSWSSVMIEITPTKCSKAEGLKFYLDYHKINDDEIFVVGDSGNDISMFNTFYENSFCMSHASLSVSKYANHIIDRFTDLEKYLDTEGKEEENV